MLISIFPRLPRSVKSRLYFPVIYRQSKLKNILLFSSRRTGSTLLEQVITCNRGFRSIDQPFDLFFPKTAAGRLKARNLPVKELSQFISLSPSEEIQVTRYMNLSLSGKLRLLGGIEQYDFPVPGHRTFMKVLNASALIDWFPQTFNVYTCYLVRHPIPQALSVMQNNWGITASAYIKAPTFVERYLTDKQVALAEQTLQSGSYFQQAVLNWVCENLVPLKFAKTTFPKVAYEDLVTDPEAVVSLLANRLDLPDKDRMLQEVTRPSRSAKFSGQSNQKLLKSRDPEAIVSSWMKKVTDSQRREADAVLSAFEISLYSSDNPKPTQNP